MRTLLLRLGLPLSILLGSLAVGPAVEPYPAPRFPFPIPGDNATEFSIGPEHQTLRHEITTAP